MRSIAGFDGYEIDESGNVYSLFVKRLMKVKISSAGYSSIGLRREGKYHWFNCHRLVLMTFGGHCDGTEKLQACHIDGDKRNNHISNLRWDTPAGNTRDKYHHGTMFNVKRGEQHHKAKLTIALVIKLRQEAQSKNCTELSFLYGIPKLTVYDAVVGNSWKSVDVRQAPVLLAGRQYAKSKK